MIDEARQTPAKRHTAFAAIMAGLVLVFIGLGTWQVQRLFWKLDLIERVDARVHAPAVAAPAPDVEIEPANDEYRRVTAIGRLLNDRETLVQAVTELGPGFWVLTPLETVDWGTILINRGFVPATKRAPSTRVEAQFSQSVTVTGLLRLSEPEGGFLRHNDPAADRWYSRDVEAIATARGLTNTPPYFIDADATPNPGGYPVGGLTIVKFRNSHLVYALTWYSLAVMSAFAVYFLLRRPKAAEG